MGVSTPACPPLLWAGPGAVSQPRQQWARPALPALEPSNSQWMVLEGPSCYHIPHIRSAGPGLRDLHVTTSKGNTGHHRICSIQMGAAGFPQGRTTSTARAGSPSRGRNVAHGTSSDNRRLQTVWHRQGGECEPPPPQHPAVVKPVTAGPSPEQAVGFIELFTQLFPKSPLSHTNHKKTWASRLNTLSQPYSHPPPWQGSDKCLWCGRVWRYRARGAEPAQSGSSPISPQDKAERFQSSAHCLFHAALGSPGSKRALQVFMAVSRDL